MFFSISHLISGLVVAMKQAEKAFLDPWTIQSGCPTLLRNTTSDDEDLSPSPIPRRGCRRSRSNKKSVGSGVRFSRIFKKSSVDGNLVLFLPQREIMISESGVEPLMGVALVHEDVLKKTKGVRIFLQVILTYR